MAELVPGPVPIAIYQLAREFEWWSWLCDLCFKCHQADGWQKRVMKAPPRGGLTCDHCGANKPGITAYYLADPPPGPTQPPTGESR